MRLDFLSRKASHADPKDPVPQRQSTLIQALREKKQINIFFTCQLLRPFFDAFREDLGLLAGERDLDRDRDRDLDRDRGLCCNRALAF